MGIVQARHNLSVQGDDPDEAITMLLRTVELEWGGWRIDGEITVEADSSGWWATAEIVRDVVVD